MLNQYKFTLYGVAAVLLWSSMLGFARKVAEQLGPIGGAAWIYTVASMFLLIVIGVPKWRNLSWRYVLIGGGLFAAYEVCLALSLGMANDRHQAMQMAVINYLWPALTVLLAVIVSNKKTNILVYPSVALAFIGVAWTITGDEGLSVAKLAASVATNPLTYSLAFIGAFLWAIYCNVTKRLSGGQKAITLFFAMTAVSLWTQYAFSDEIGMTFSLSAAGNVLWTGIVMGGGYALWNVAILGGNMVLLATLSYFTPIFSTLLSSVILGVALTGSFWQGVLMVTIGSLICWWVTRDKRSQAADSPASAQSNAS